MIKAVVLDTTPLGLATQRQGKSPEADACKQWVADCATAGLTVYVPEIADYEVRRELLRTGNTAGIRRLDIMQATAYFLPITTPAMRLAAALWAQARNQGQPTAAPEALDGDVILIAQARTLNLADSEFIIATGNVRHIARFAPADTWQNIVP